MLRFTERYGRQLPGSVESFRKDGDTYLVSMLADGFQYYRLLANGRINQLDFQAISQPAVIEVAQRDAGPWIFAQDKSSLFATQLSSFEGTRSDRFARRDAILPESDNYGLPGNDLEDGISDLAFASRGGKDFLIAASLMGFSLGVYRVNTEGDFTRTQVRSAGEDWTYDHTASIPHISVLEMKHRTLVAASGYDQAFVTLFTLSSKGKLKLIDGRYASEDQRLGTIYINKVELVDVNGTPIILTDAGYIYGLDENNDLIELNRVDFLGQNFEVVSIDGRTIVVSGSMDIGGYELST